MNSQSNLLRKNKPDEVKVGPISRRKLRTKSNDENNQIQLVQKKNDNFFIARKSKAKIRNLS